MGGYVEESIASKCRGREIGLFKLSIPLYTCLINPSGPSLAVDVGQSQQHSVQYFKPLWLRYLNVSPICDKDKDFVISPVHRSPVFLQVGSDVRMFCTESEEPGLGDEHHFLFRAQHLHETIREMHGEMIKLAAYHQRIGGYLFICRCADIMMALCVFTLAAITFVALLVTPLD